MNKYLTRTLVFIGLFGITTGVSIAITHQLNKYNAQEESEPVKQTDTQQFVSKLATFGNLEGNVDLSGTINDVDLSAKGNVFVSLESLNKLAVKADLEIEMSSTTYPVTITYVDEIIFFDYYFMHIKAKKDDFPLVVEGLKKIGIELKMPKEFKDLTPSQLLNNLNNMTSRIEGNQIIYTCNLIDGLSPILFTSNIEHQLTGVSVTDFKTETFVASLDSKINVLGRGHNKITNPEKEGQEYVDISEYIK